jgi:hypothetical protein
MLLLITGLSVGVMLAMLFSYVLAGWKVRKLVTEHKVIRERFEAAVAEFEGFVRRMSKEGKDGQDRERLS